MVSRDEWVAARKELLQEEKAMTRARDALNTKRRELPMVEIDKPYVFEGPEGKADLAGPVRRPSPTHRAAFHVRSELGQGMSELHRRLPTRSQPDSSTTCTPATPRSSYVSRAPFDKIEALQGPNAGRAFPWYSSFGSDFNYDFHVTLDASVTPVM